MNLEAKQIGQGNEQTYFKETDKDECYIIRKQVYLRLLVSFLSRKVV